ncbi:polyketide cyclase [Mycobacteriaceae bacterium 1482268.1]|nr:polyketide cyclase [Mycobacteriaceae bacterium 1482268.1]
MGVVTTRSEATFVAPPETVYDFVSNPANWTKTYPGGPLIRNLPAHLPLRVGDTWDEADPHPDRDRVFTWQLAVAARPVLFVFHSVGRLGHDSRGDGGMEGRMAVEYHFTRPEPDRTLFTRTMTIETYRHAPMTDGFFRIVNPSHIDAYLAAIARELAR